MPAVPPTAVPKVRTARLLLREWRDSDHGPFAALKADPVVMEDFRGTATRAESDAMVDGRDPALDSSVAFTAVTNGRSARVMQRLGMRREPEHDFDHPRVPEGSPVRRHVFYRMTRDRWAAR